MLKRVLTSAVVFTATFAAVPANAHTSYMLPSTFNTEREQTVTLECSFSEDFSAPEIAVKSDDYHVVGPDGTRVDFETLAPFKQLMLMEHGLTDDGTYRFTTGVRLGRKSKRALIDGEWKFVFGPNADEMVANAEAVKTSQTETVADVYVSKGAPSWTPVRNTFGRLVLEPLTHPNEVFLEDEFQLKVSFDGTPMADKELTVYRRGGSYEEPKYKHAVSTDENGIVSMPFEKPGIYMIMTRHRAEAPEGSETDERGYTTSLTFEVMR